MLPDPVTPHRRQTQPAVYNNATPSGHGIIWRQLEPKLRSTGLIHLADTKTNSTSKDLDENATSQDITCSVPTSAITVSGHHRNMSAGSVDRSDEIAIIGAGMGGLTLALTLSTHSVPCRIYEARSASAGPSLGGAMMLSPNSIVLFDRLGIYQDLLSLSCPFESVYYKSAMEDERTTDAYPMGGEKTYGYPALRTYRRDLHRLLVQKCAERGVQVEYDSKFVRVVSEDAAEGVTFELANGEKRAAKLLIGSDGIHSSVRKYVTELRPMFVNFVAVAYAAKTASLRIPADKDYKFPVTITSKAGNVVLAPQCQDGSEMMAGRQFPFQGTEPSREEWESLARDKARMKGMLRERIDEFPDIAQSAFMDALDDEGAEESLYIWPFYKLPSLPRWTSSPGRVVLIGDAAHAIPPTTGQGMGMAVEDGVTLGELVAAAARPCTREARQEGQAQCLGDALEWWQETRRKRIDDLVKLTGKLNNRRLPPEQQSKLPREQLWIDESETNPRQMAWLYEPQVLNEVEKWLGQYEVK